MLEHDVKLVDEQSVSRHFFCDEFHLDLKIVKTIGEWRREEEGGKGRKRRNLIIQEKEQFKKSS